MTPKNAILVKLLAEADAVCLPVRSWTRPVPGNTYHARKGFSRGGVAWVVEGVGDAERKAMQRALVGLVGDGLVQVRRAGRVKILSAKLCSEGERQARQLVGVPGMYDGWLSAVQIAKHSKRPPKLLTDSWVSERFLIRDAEPFGREAWLTESMMLPALVHGYVVSNSDVHGRVYYKITDEGWKWLEGTPPADDESTPTHEAAALYQETLNAALDRLSTAAPNDPREIGEIPLPTSMVGVKL